MKEAPPEQASQIREAESNLPTEDDFGPEGI